MVSDKSRLSVRIGNPDSPVGTSEIMLFGTENMFFLHFLVSIVVASSSRNYRGILLATSGYNVSPYVWGGLLARLRKAR